MLLHFWFKTMHCIITLWDFLFCVTQENKKNTYFYKSCSKKTARTNPKIHKHWHDIVQWSALSLRFKFQWTGLSTQKQHFCTFLYQETDNGGAKTFDPGGIAGGRPGYGCCLPFLPGWTKKARVWFVKCESALALCPHHGDIWHKQASVLTEVSISILKQWAVLHWNTPLAFSW